MEQTFRSALSLRGPVTATPAKPGELPVTTRLQLAAHLRVGDLVFIRIPYKPFLEVAKATGSWTNHVGIVVGMRGCEPQIAESAFPLARTTTLSRFLRRSAGGRIAVRRSPRGLSALEQNLLRQAVQDRAGRFYDTGFNLKSGRQFCSRYVREVLFEATGVAVGEVQSFSDLYASQPAAALRFWKIWFLGAIPWTRETVTPASLLRCPQLGSVFDGVAR